MITFLCFILAIWYVFIDTRMYAKNSPIAGKSLLWVILALIPGAGLYYYLKNRRVVFK